MLTSKMNAELSNAGSLGSKLGLYRRIRLVARLIPYNFICTFNVKRVPVNLCEQLFSLCRCTSTILRTQGQLYTESRSTSTPSHLGILADSGRVFPGLIHVSQLLKHISESLDEEFLLYANHWNIIIEFVSEV